MADQRKTLGGRLALNSAVLPAVSSPCQKIMVAELSPE
jgi:hypothetical protein